MRVCSQRSARKSLTDSPLLSVLCVEITPGITILTATQANGWVKKVYANPNKRQIKWNRTIGITLHSKTAVCWIKQLDNCLADQRLDTTNWPLDLLTDRLTVWRNDCLLCDPQKPAIHRPNLPKSLPSNLLTYPLLVDQKVMKVLCSHVCAIRWKLLQKVDNFFSCGNGLEKRCKLVLVKCCVTISIYFLIKEDFFNK